MNSRLVKLITAIALSCGLTACSLMNKKSAPSAAVTTQPTQTALAFQANEKFGEGLTGTDRASLSNAERRALDYGKAGEQIGWKGEKGEVSGTIIASQPFRVGGSNCRRFEHKMTSVSGPSSANGTACKRSDGSWRLVS